MRLKEQRLWDRMRAHRQPEVRLERVENMLSDGFPDVVVKPAGADSPVIMCELKAVTALPTRITTRVFGDEGLTIGQRNWLLDWAKYNGRAILLASACEGADARHWVIPATHAEKFNDMTLIDLRDASATRDVERGRKFWLAFYDFLKEML